MADREVSFNAPPGWRRALARVLPTSTGLTDDAWRARHRAIATVAWFHGVGVPLFAIWRGRTPEQALIETSPILLFALIGALPLNRRVRAVSVTLALLLSSAVLVHLSDGLVEMHFHVFVMIPIIALYQDWLPFGVAVSFVFLHRGVIGTLFPQLVFEHVDAQTAPWRWAVLHAVFVAALSVVCIAGWRINQLVLDRQRRAESDLLDEKRVVETLHAIGTGIVSELDMGRVSQLVIDAAVNAIGAEFGAFFYNVQDSDGVSYMLYTLSGAPPEAFSSFPIPRNTKVFGPTFAGAGIVRSDDITADERYGHNAPYNGMPPGHLPVRSYLAVPVLSRGSSEVLGGLFFGHSLAAMFDERDERIVVGIATQAAIAFDNARLYQAEREAYEAAESARARVTMLADVGRILVSSLVAEEMIANLTRITVPTFADVCVLDMVRPDGSLDRVDVVGGPGFETYAENLKRFPPDTSNAEHPVVRVLNGEGPILTNKLTPELIQQNTINEEHAELIRRMDGTSSIVVPLVGRGEVLGVVSFLTIAASERTFTEEDIPLAEVLGRRAGMAVENAQLFEAEHIAREEATRASTALTLLADVGRLSSTPLDEDVRVQQLAHVAVPRLADACMIDILEEEGTIRRVAAAGPGFEAFADDIAKFPPNADDHSHPVIQVMNGAPTVFVEHIGQSFIEQVSRSQAHRATAERAAVGSTIIVPLSARGGIYGALTLINFAEGGRRFHEDNVPLAEEIGRRAGVAVHNARLYRTERRALETAEAARARLTLLSDASRVLASSLDIETTLANVAALTVPTLADLCVIDLIDDVGDMRRVAASGAPGLEDFAAQTRASFPANPPPEHPVMRVVQGHGTQHMGAIPHEYIERLSPDEEWLLRVEKVNVLSSIMVPLMGRANVLGGVLSLVTTAHSGRRLTDDDIPLAEEIGRRAGIAVENARLYAQQRSVAESLQHALLPQELPSIAGFEVTARYQPGGPGERVGGDWYDLFEVPTGDLAIVMGDVVGHGIPAASLMAQLRNALRAYAWDGMGPADVLTRLNQFLYGLEREGMATVSIGLLNPIRNTMRVANAGHPPFLRLPEDGDPTFVGEGLGPPIGAVPFASFKEELLELADRDTLVFYTDGLIEDRTASLDAGLERMRGAVEGGEQDIESLCESILSACLGDRNVEDDVAILVLRALRMGSKLSMRLPAEPRVLSSLRQTLRRWLREHRVDEPDVQDVLVAMGEACNNAIEHGAAPLGGWFEVEAEIDGDLDVVVRSSGSWRAPRDDGGGRGLPVMEALMDRVDVDRSGDGIQVRMHRKLNGSRDTSG